MNVTHFLWEFPPVLKGGLGTFGLELALQQSAQKHSVSIFSLNENNDYNPKSKWNGITVYRPYLLDATTVFYLASNSELRNWGTNFKFFADVINYNVLSAERLVEMVRNNTYQLDIVHAHDWLGIPGGMIAQKELDVPLLFHVHSTETGRSIGGGSTTVKEIEFEGGQIANGIITVSNVMKEELIHLGFPANKIHVVWNGVNPNKYDPAIISHEKIKQLRKKYCIKPSDIMLFFIGRLVTVKGPDKLIQAMPDVIKDFPNAKLVLLGIGDMEVSIKKQIIDLGLKNHVFLQNEFVNESKRILHYAASDVVILPSLYEPFGIVCTEAMSMAKPVVVGAHGTNGMREQVIPSGNNQCGVHINPHDPCDIAWGIKEILKREDTGKQLGKNARKRVLKEFCWEVVSKRIDKIYKAYV